MTYRDFIPVLSWMGRKLILTLALSRIVGYNGELYRDIDRLSSMTRSLLRMIFRNYKICVLMARMFISVPVTCNL